MKRPPRPMGLNCRKDTGPTGARRLTGTMRGLGVAVEHAYPQWVVRENPQRDMLRTTIPPRSWRCPLGTVKINEGKGPT